MDSKFTPMLASYATVSGDNCHDEGQ